MTIKRSILLTVILFLALTAVCFQGCRKKTVSTNVILIIIDTVRRDHVSCYGYERETTPNIDALAEDGVRFDNAVSACPWTLPSIASILTGQNPSTHQAGIHLDPYTMTDRRLSTMRDTVISISEVFQQRGYSTVGFFENPFVDPGFGLNRGFDIYDFAPGDNLRIRRADKVAAAAMNYIENRGKTSQGFFMVLHFFDPHLAYDPPVEFMAPYTYGYKGDMKPPFDPEIKALRSGKESLSVKDREFIIGLYDGEIAFVDSSAGKFLYYLKQKNLYDTSLIIVTSDHGEEFWDHGGFEHGHTLHRELVDVPLIMKFPGSQNSGMHVQERLSLTDLFPSIVDYMGWSVPFQTDGHSFIPIAGTIDVKPKSIIAENLHYGPQQQCLYKGDYKMILNQYGKIQVYNLKNDPLETENVFGKEKDLPEEIHGQIKYMAEQIEEMLKEPKQAAEIDKETKEKLRSLGYIE